MAGGAKRKAHGNHKNGWGWWQLRKVALRTVGQSAVLRGQKCQQRYSRKDSLKLSQSADKESAMLSRLSKWKSDGLKEGVNKSRWDNRNQTTLEMIKKRKENFSDLILLLELTESISLIRCLRKCYRVYFQY